MNRLSGCLERFLIELFLVMLVLGLLGWALFSTFRK